MCCIPLSLPNGFLTLCHYRDRDGVLSCLNLSLYMARVLNFLSIPHQLDYLQHTQFGFLGSVSWARESGWLMWPAPLAAYSATTLLIRFVQVNNLRWWIYHRFVRALRGKGILRGGGGGLWEWVLSLIQEGETWGGAGPLACCLLWICHMKTWCMTPLYLLCTHEAKPREWQRNWQKRASTSLNWQTDQPLSHLPSDFLLHEVSLRFKLLWLGCPVTWSQEDPDRYRIARLFRPCGLGPRSPVVNL